METGLVGVAPCLILSPRPGAVHAGIKAPGQHTELSEEIGWHSDV